MNKSPVVTISITAYNHAEYISQCIESILAQKLEYEYEILIGEDDSTDSTRAICKKYAEEFPDKIKLFLHSRNSVIYIDGQPTGRYNLLNNLRSAKGKYIALIDGDDYWTNPDKLQTQIDFLEQNSEFSICFHNSSIVNEKNEEIDLFHKSSLRKDVFTIEDIAKSNIIPTASVVFRNHYMGVFPEWYMKFRTGDWGMHILHSMKGNLKYFDECWSAYRVHGRSSWSSQSRDEQIERILKLYDILIENLEPEYSVYFRKEKGNWVKNLSNGNVSPVGLDQKQSFLKRIANKLKRTWPSKKS